MMHCFVLFKYLSSRGINRASNSILCGKDCFLKGEQKETKFVDLKIVRWNDSSFVEKMADEENEEGDEPEPNNDEFQSSQLPLKAVALWDSSIHQSQYLNQITPSDKQIYFTIKVNLKLKIHSNSETQTYFENSKSKFVDLVLRKRVGVNVYLPNSSYSSKFTLGRFKNLLGRAPSRNTLSPSQPLTSTSVTYRVIANIPRLLTEVETRESLALKAASSLADETIDDQKFLKKTSNRDEKSHFEHYSKVVEAVDSLIKLDRVQQQIAMKNACNYFYKTGSASASPISTHNFSSYDSMSSKKTLSVPNLLKNRFGSLINLNTSNSKEFSPNKKPSLAPITDDTILPNFDLSYVTAEAKNRLSKYET